MGVFQKDARVARENLQINPCFLSSSPCSSLDRSPSPNLLPLRAASISNRPADVPDVLLLGQTDVVDLPTAWLASCGSAQSRILHAVNWLEKSKHKILHAVNSKRRKTCYRCHLVKSSLRKSNTLGPEMYALSTSREHRQHEARHRHDHHHTNSIYDWRRTTLWATVRLRRRRWTVSWRLRLGLGATPPLPLSSPAAPTERKEVWGWGSIVGGARRRRNKARLYL